MQIARYFSSDLFAGKTVFVTGGGSGINLGVAKSFAAVGASVAICGRTRERLDVAGREIEALGAKVFTKVADVRDPAALQAAVDETRDALGPIDVLVCGAAGNFLCRAEDLSPNGFKTVVEIDLLGSFHAARACLAQLKETKGTILFISAGMAYMPYAFQVHAGAAKAGIENLMKNLALEWGHYGIRACSIVPGPIEGTEGMKRLADAEDLRRRLERIPMQRMGTVDDIGMAAVFLASPMASYVTGAQLVVDGGSGLAGSAFFNIGAEKALRPRE
ncbi:MAG TPA: SDR family oxidoreductase [Hyphomicrobiaceae bacterium]|jgi:NAD(P)-dependent dehydrogenase (short-subunit alcohol dehydrogenase family)|nr:SDR family oxidoreductase [Hyphomicrobiaceae bacterium]